MEVKVDKRKKKRITIGDVGEGERDRLKKLKGEEGDGGGAAGGSSGGAAGGSSGGYDTVVLPTEEEVEEFYTILRRMRVAVKYFDEKGRGGKEWREVLEQAEVTVVDDDANAVDDDHREAGCSAVIKNKGYQEVLVNEGFDLNAVAPEATDGSDA